ncbi:hypothetical protein [Burkholderia sp. Ac-20353]|nr:hypothetical protein [Burkholderia sp. Ac-20353]
MSDDDAFTDLKPCAARSAAKLRGTSGPGLPGGTTKTFPPTDDAR